MVEQDLEFGGLRLTTEGRAVLEGNEKVLVLLDRAPAAPSPDTACRQHDPELFERLRTLRRALADEVHLPAYIVFSDRALTEMAASQPQTDDQFLAIMGVGQAKLVKYGAQFLAAIRQYRSDRSLAVKTGSELPQSKPIVRPVRRRRCQDVGELFNAGNGVEAIGRRFNIISGTVLEHLERFVQGGGHLDAQRVLDQSQLTDSKRALALSAFERLGLERLAPVHEALAGAVSYDELRVLRLYLMCRQKET